VQQRLKLLANAAMNELRSDHEIRSRSPMLRELCPAMANKTYFNEDAIPINIS